MDMPPIHMCAFLNHENARLKAKIVDLKQQRTRLEQIIADNHHDHARSCSISCQTDIDVVHRHAPPTAPDEQARLHRLLSAQNDLLRKYENEAQRDRQQPSSSGVIQEYERRLHRCEMEKRDAEQRATQLETRLATIEERYGRMRQELSVLDENFFDEIEDLKFALQQASNLNREYEKTVHMLSNRLGIVYPKVERKEA